MTGAEQRVHDRIARRRDDLIDLLTELVAFDTRVAEPSLAPRDEAALQALVAQRLGAAGLQLDVWEPDLSQIDLERFPISHSHHLHGRPQLLARAKGAGGGRTLLLNGHIDTVNVEPRQRWSSDPFRAEVRDGRLYGRGSCDMKGGVASMLIATEVLRELQVPLLGDIIVNTVTDEESTGAGSLASSLRVSADGGIVTEPTDCRPWLGTRGSLHPHVVVEGRTGHAAYPYQPNSPVAPVNAFEKALLIHSALQGLAREWHERDDLSHPHLEVGSIVPVQVGAGDWIVSVPQSCTLDYHVQYLPQQADANGWGTPVEAEIEACVREAARADPWLAAHPPSVSWDGDSPADDHPVDTPIAAAVLNGMAAVGLEPAVGSRTTFFDGPYFSRRGTPTIAFGPGDMQIAHTVDEFVPVDELVLAAQVIAVTAMRFCGVGEDG